MGAGAAPNSKDASGGEKANIGGAPQPAEASVATPPWNGRDAGTAAAPTEKENAGSGGGAGEPLADATDGTTAASNAPADCGAAGARVGCPIENENADAIAGGFCPEKRDKKKRDICQHTGSGTWRVRRAAMMQ